MFQKLVIEKKEQQVMCVCGGAFVCFVDVAQGKVMLGKRNLDFQWFRAYEKLVQRVFLQEVTHGAGLPEVWLC